MMLAGRSCRCVCVDGVLKRQDSEYVMTLYCARRKLSTRQRGIQWSMQERHPREQGAVQNDRGAEASVWPRARADRGVYRLGPAKADGLPRFREPRERGEEVGGASMMIP